jgi:hypothetical protein
MIALAPEVCWGLPALGEDDAGGGELVVILAELMLKVLMLKVLVVLVLLKALIKSDDNAVGIP